MSNKDKIITELLEKTQQMQEHMELQEKTIQILLRSNKQIIDWVDDIVKDQEHFRENYFLAQENHNRFTGWTQVESEKRAEKIDC